MLLQDYELATSLVAVLIHCAQQRSHMIVVPISAADIALLKS